MPKPIGPLLFDEDSFETRLGISKLRKLNFWVERKTFHHVRVNRWNFYPTTGVIVFDGQGRERERGWDAFIALLAKHYRRRAVETTTAANTIDFSLARTEKMRRSLGGEEASPQRADQINQINLSDVRYANSDNGEAAE